MAYLGAESGDDVVLEKVNKRETQASTIEALNKMGKAGIAGSVMLLNGLGARALAGAEPAAGHRP
jgi:radical SAM superfamily enzyme YgiQ (UPF0313 family)